MLDRDSDDEILRAAVLRGIGEQRDVEATDLLLGWTPRSRPQQCRTAAFEALALLAETGEWNEATAQRVVEALTAALAKGEHRDVKTRAAQTLRVLGEQAAPALAALEALAAHDDNPQVREQAKETVDKVRAGAPPRLELTRLRDELRKLREANDAMRDRLARLEKTAPEPAGK
jgi:hypothetical protein